MGRNTPKQQAPTPEEHVLHAQREYNRRDWEREQKKQLTVTLRDPLKLAERNPHPTFWVRFAPTANADRQFVTNSLVLNPGGFPQATGVGTACQGTGRLVIAAKVIQTTLQETK